MKVWHAKNGECKPGDVTCMVEKDGNKIYLKEIKIIKGKDGKMVIEGAPGMQVGCEGQAVPPPVCPHCGKPLPPPMMVVEDKMMWISPDGKHPMPVSEHKMEWQPGAMPPPILRDPQPGEVLALFISEHDLQMALKGTSKEFRVSMPVSLPADHHKFNFVMPKGKVILRKESCEKDCQQSCN